MNIAINITEEELKFHLETAVENVARGVVNEAWNRNMRIDAFNRIVDRVTEGVLEIMPDYFEDKSEAIINKTADKLAKSLRISNSEILAALLAMANDEEA